MPGPRALFLSWFWAPRPNRSFSGPLSEFTEGSSALAQGSEQNKNSEPRFRGEERGTKRASGLLQVTS